MKAIVTIFFLIISLSSFSQQKRPSGFFTLTGSKSISEHKATGVAVNFGAHVTKSFAVGLGFEGWKFDELKTYVVPVYADLRLILKDIKVIEPFITAQPGYSFFNHVQSGNEFSIKKTGGMYFSTGVGMKVKIPLSPVISIRYASYQFNSTGGSHFEDKSRNNINSIVVNAGISL